MPTPVQGRRLPPNPNGGVGVLVYDLDVVPKVATERRWEWAETIASRHGWSWTRDAVRGGGAACSKR
jgi:hypothetical protein